MDWCSICSVADVVCVCCSKERAECESEAVYLLANLYFYLLGNDQKNKIADRNKLSLNGVCALS